MRSSSWAPGRDQDARLPRRRTRQRLPGALRRLQRQRVDCPAARRRSYCSATTAWTFTASSATSTATSTRFPPVLGRRLVLFLGGTLGNLYRDERVALLRQIGALLGPDDRLLVGVDLVKDVERASSGPTTTRRASRRRSTRTCSTHQPRPGRRLRPRGVSAHRLLQHGGVAHRDAPTAPDAADGAPQGIDLTMTVEPDGDDLDGELAQVHAGTVNQMLTAAGLSLREWYAAPRDMFGLAAGGPGVVERGEIAALRGRTTLIQPLATGIPSPRGAIGNLLRQLAARGSGTGRLLWRRRRRLPGRS